MTEQVTILKRFQLQISGQSWKQIGNRVLRWFVGGVRIHLANCNELLHNITNRQLRDIRIKKSIFLENNFRNASFEAILRAGYI